MREWGGLGMTECCTNAVRDGCVSAGGWGHERGRDGCVSAGGMVV